MVESNSEEGKRLFELTEITLSSYGFDITNCISDSTDGAPNMQGQYSGFTTWFENESPEHIHTWCYVHVLNLVMKGTFNNSIRTYK